MVQRVALIFQECTWITLYTLSSSGGNTSTEIHVSKYMDAYQVYRTKAISYTPNNKLILKTENGGFSTFAGVFDPGNGRIGPALLRVRLAFLRDASNDV